MDALLVPVLAGVNVITTEHVAFAASTLHELLAILNSVGTVLVTLETVTESAPTFRSVTDALALVAPMVVLEKFTLLGCWICPSVGGGEGGGFETPHELHWQLGLTVPSLQITRPSLAQLWVIPP